MAPKGTGGRKANRKKVSDEPAVCSAAPATSSRYSIPVFYAKADMVWRHSCDDEDMPAKIAIQEAARITQETSGISTQLEVLTIFPTNIGDTECITVSEWFSLAKEPIIDVHSKPNTGLLTEVQDSKETPITGGLVECGGYQRLKARVDQLRESIDMLEQQRLQSESVQNRLLSDLQKQVACLESLCRKSETEIDSLSSHVSSLVKVRAAMLEQLQGVTRTFSQIRTGDESQVENQSTI